MSGLILNHVYGYLQRELRVIFYIVSARKKATVNEDVHFKRQKSSNKLRMKALVVWDIHYQFLKLINFIVFFTKIKHDMDKEEKTQMSL